MDKRDFYKGMTDGDLAEVLVGLKENAATLRQEVWYAEDELRDRLLKRNATVILAENYRVKSSVKRETEWDQDGLRSAAIVAASYNLADQFGKAFPLRYGSSVRNLNALLKLGGEMAKAIEAARGEVKEKVAIVVEALSSGVTR